MSSKSSVDLSQKSPSFQRMSNLSQHEIELRIDAPQNSVMFTHSGIVMKYAWASQRGYYPDTPDKENQDSYSILPQIRVKEESSDVALFGVYDGHGTDGHLAARYVRSQVVSHITRILIRTYINFTTRPVPAHVTLISSHPPHVTHLICCLDALDTCT